MALPALSGVVDDMSELLTTAWQELDSWIVSLFPRHQLENNKNPRIRFFLYSVMILTCTFFIFFILNFFQMRQGRSLAAAFAGAGQVIVLLILRSNANPRIAFRISALAMLGYSLFLLGTGGPGGARVFWMLVFPVYSFLLFGGRESILWTLAGFIGSVCVLVNPNDLAATFSVENNRFLLTYGLLGALAGAFEMVVYRVQEAIATERTRQLEEALLRLSMQYEERKRAEEALAISEERLRTFSEAAFEGIVLSDVGLLVDMNDQFARMLGYERSEIIGKPVVHCVAPEHHELVQSAIRSGEKGPYEHLALRKDGSVFPVEAQAGTSTVGGRVLRAAALRDISERKRAEAEIREAKEYAEAILESLPGTFYVFDEELRLKHWNKNFEKVSGFSSEELAGKHPLDFIEEKDRAAVAKKLEYNIANGTATIEANALSKTGDTTPYFFNAVWRTLGGRRHLVGTGVDLSEQKRAQELLRRSEELFRTAFETAADAMAISEMERGIYTDANQSFAEITGYSKDELIGSSTIDLGIWVDVFARDDLIQKLARTGFVRNLETKFRCKNGTVKTGLLSASAVVLDGEPHLLSVVKDITDLKSGEAERLKLERQVQHSQKLESLGILAGGIAHDFNNILTSILGNADLALMRMSSMAPARRNLEEIRRGVLRAAGLANQMLAYSGKGKFELKSINLSILVKEMAQLLDVSISKKHLLTYNLAEDLPLFDGDVNQIQQIVMNLITNASESIGEEDGVIKLATGFVSCDRTCLDALREGGQASHEELLPEGIYVFLEVTDTGCGMDPETQSKIFDPFFTTKFSGRGLGMAAVLGIVKGHKGVVNVYSEVGKGSRFKVLFPARKDLQTGWMADAEDQSACELWHEGVVLVVDDEVTIINVATEMLEEIGLRVLTASDGSQAVEEFRRNVDRISCVLLDLTMPGLDGAQVFHEMRRINPQVKVVLSSGYNEQDVTQRFVGEGLAGFIQKPYTIAKLREKLNEVFGKGSSYSPVAT
jgi:two-component system cell cycle sensor histidine kinase/response regulator CckA